MNFVNNRSGIGLLILLFLPSVIVRLPGLFTTNGLWLDEIWTMITAHPANSLEAVLTSSANDISPPLYYLCLKFFLSAFGVTDFNARLFSFILAVSSNAIMAVLAYKIGKINLAAWFIALMSFNLFLIQYSFEVRFYALILFLISLFSLIYYTIKFQNKTSFYYPIILSLIVSASLYTHYHVAFFYIGLGLYELIYFFRKWQRTKLAEMASLFIIIGLLVGACLFLPWAFVLSRQLAKGGTGWLGLPGVGSLFEFWYVIASKNTLIFLFWLVGFVLLFRSDSAWNEGQIVRPFGWAIISSWLLPFTVSFLLVPMFLPRYLILLMPAWLLVVSIGLSRLRKNLRLPSYLILYLGCFAWVVFLQGVFQPKNRDSFKDASILVSQKIQSEREPVFSTFAWCNNYYFQQLGEVRAKEVGDSLFPVSKNQPDTNQIQSFWLITHLNYQWGHDTLRIASLQPRYTIASADTLDRAYVYHYELAKKK